MIHILDFCRSNMGGAGTVVCALIFLALTVLGVIIAMRGRGAMIWLVSVCAFICGLLGGAMIGILVFNSIIIMAVLASVCAVLLVVVVRRFRSIGYFIGIGSLSGFLAYMITSQMYKPNSGLSWTALLFIDLVTGFIMGIMAACRSKYTVTLITAITGGVIASVSALALIGFYFVDIKTWILAIVVAIIGIMIQFNIYDIKPSKRKKRK